MTFYQKSLWNIRSRLNSSIFWVFTCTSKDNPPSFFFLPLRQNYSKILTKSSISYYFLINSSQKIPPKKFSQKNPPKKSSQKIPLKKFSWEIPKNFLKKPRNFLTIWKYPIPYIALGGRKPFRVCYFFFWNTREKFLSFRSNLSLLNLTVQFNLVVFFLWLWMVLSFLRLNRRKYCRPYIRPHLPIIHRQLTGFWCC
mgnify:CR=1 FL=1